MKTETDVALAKRNCKPCEGGVEAISADQATAQLANLEGWQLAADGKRIRKEWIVKDFVAAVKFFKRIARIAEAEDHHPDLHLTGYRNVAVELSTHAIGGLSENDFILAAKIDELRVKLKKMAKSDASG